jgi:hypothetical protein
MDSKLAVIATVSIVAGFATYLCAVLFVVHVF